MSSNKHLLGKWAQEKPGGDFTLIEIIDADDFHAYIKGNQNKPITIQDLQDNWQRAEEIVDDPFKNPDLSSLATVDRTLQIDEESMQEAANDFKNVKSEVKQEDVIDNYSTTVQLMPQSTDPVEQAILAIIAASTTREKLTLQIQVDLPVQLTAYSTITGAMQVPFKQSASILANSIKLNSQELNAAIAEALLEQLTTSVKG